MEFIEAPLFSRDIHKYLSHDEYASLQWELSTRPGVGKIMRKSGGLRKLRWSCRNHGKRGGVRVIYYWHKGPEQILLLSIYAKNETETLSENDLKQLRKEIER